MKIFIFTGASGCGKSTIGAALREHGLTELVSDTTRAPRQGEVHGSDYYFVKKEDVCFAKEAGNKTAYWIGGKAGPEKYLEYTQYSDNFYGLRESEAVIVTQGCKKAFCIMDNNGVEAMLAFQEANSGIQFEVVPVFVMVTPAVAVSRMLSRGDTQESATRRLLHAMQNNEFAPRSHHKKIIVADCDRKDVIEQLAKIVEW